MKPTMPFKTLVLETFSAEQTRRLAAIFGRLLSAGALIALTGELGCGKTAFVKGLAKGLDVPDTFYVTSPSYTLINEYPARWPLFHVDLYRLGHPDEIEDIGFYDLFHADNILAIEWAERIPAGLLHEHYQVHIEITGTQSRRIRLSGYGLEQIDLIKKLGNQSNAL